MTTTRIGDSPSPSNGHRLPFGALAALLLVAVSSLFLLAACGGDDEEEAGTPSGTQAPAGTASPAAEETATAAPQASGDELDPCALVTKADAEEVIGATLGEAERQTTGPFETCIYSDDAGNYVQVQASDDVYTESNFDDAIQAAAEAVDAEAEPVSGVGDKAYWFLDVIWVQKGDVTLDILVNTPEITDLRLQGDEEGEKQESLRITTELASKAVDALP